MESLLNEYLVSSGSYDRARPAPAWRPAQGAEPPRRAFRIRRHRRTDRS